MKYDTGTFHRSLNLFDSTAIVMGSMIGSAIFIVSADISRNVGSPGWLLLVWLITGMMTVFAALSYGELAGMMPKAGGIYVYLREAYSPLFGFLYGWTLFLVVQCGTIAAVAMAFSKFLGVLFPWIAEDNLFFQYKGLSVNFTQFIAILSILFLTWINKLGVEEGKKVQNFFTYSKILILVLLILIGYIFSSSFASANWWHASKAEQGISIPIHGFALVVGIGISMVGSLFASDAWYNITFTSGEVINPKRNIPLSLFLGTLIVCFLYLLVNVIYIKILPVTGSQTGLTVAEQGIQFASEDRVATAAMKQILGRSAEIIMAIVLIVSTFGCNNGIILSGARVYYAMAHDRLFFNKVGQLNDKGVPEVGLWVQAVWSTVLCLSGSYSQLLDYVIFAALIFNILTISAVFVLRFRKPELERPYKTIGYPVIPAIYIFLCIFFEIILLVYKPLYTWPGLIIVLAGVPVYFLWKYNTKIIASISGKQKYT
jgi:basic amino acid/polyamine antiporter, APA family